MSGRPMRCFVAAAIEPPVAKRLAREIGFLQLAGADVKWVAPENLHITMRFLGDVATEEVMDVVEALRVAAQGVTPCTPALRGIETFPPRKPMKVIAVGVEDDTASLFEYFDRMQVELEHIGFRPETRPLRLHATLGRVKGTRGLDDLRRRLEESGKQEFGTTTISAVQLMMSELSSKGPTYTVMETFEFEG